MQTQICASWRTRGFILYMPTPLSHRFSALSKSEGCMIINYHFYDRNRVQTTDHFGGAPMTRIHLWVNDIQVVANGLGLIDTGANVTYAAEGLLAAKNINHDREVSNTTGNGPHVIGVNNSAAINLVGLAPNIPVILRRLPSFSRADVLIGRDVLDCFKLVYDPLHGIFTIEDT